MEEEKERLEFVSLADLYQELDQSEDDVNSILRTFKCNKNPDIEQFLHNTALEFELRDRSRSYLWLYPEANQLIVAGYFTLALDVVELPNKMSRSSKKRLGKGYIPTKPFLPAYLIGQPGRNENIPKILLPGKVILEKALSLIEKANSIAGNKLVIVDVIDGIEASMLVAWYKRFGFRELELMEAEGKRLHRLYLILKKMNKLKQEKL